jgi:diguanylate cyclase (GGDEF)-like protein
MSAAYESGQPLSVIFADIDQFKAVNDRYGHIAGDLVLQHVAQLLQKKVRRTDSWTARYGGDEFVICLPGVDAASARRIANRLRVAVMSERFPLEDGALSLTCSFGVYAMEQSDFQLSAIMLLHRADENLYRAKHAGRNAVV